MTPNNQTRAAAHQWAKNALYEIVNTCIDGFPMYESEVDKFADIIARHFDESALRAAAERANNFIYEAMLTNDRGKQWENIYAAKTELRAALSAEPSEGQNNL